MSNIYMQSITIWNSNRPHIFCIQNNHAPFAPIVIILEFQNNQKVDRISELSTISLPNCS